MEFPGCLEGDALFVGDVGVGYVAYDFFAAVLVEHYVHYTCCAAELDVFDFEDCGAVVCSSEEFEMECYCVRVRFVFECCAEVGADCTHDGRCNIAAVWDGADVPFRGKVCPVGVGV